MLSLKVRHVVTDETLVGLVVAVSADVDEQVEEDDLDVPDRNLGHLGTALLEEEDEPVEDPLRVEVIRH